MADFPNAARVAGSVTRTIRARETSTYNTFFKSNFAVAIPTNFYFTSHAKRRSDEREITQDLFMEVVTHPDKKKRQYRGTHGGFVYLFTKLIADKELRIAAEIYKNDCFFVTGFWS